ncbi:MAG TPA: hypothetical protein VEI82_09160, partial [Myxococcota bacterium]|nr:hypothetical protein [Myxococcota bacterium]
MRSSPHWISTCAALAAGFLLSASGFAQPSGGVDPGYRADALDPVPPDPPAEVQIVRPPGSPAWPQALASQLEARIRAEWPEGRIYGPIHSSLGIWLRDPLLTAQVGGRVLVPLLDGDALPVEGRLELPDRERARRVVVLVDASASANALTPF